jgi:leader peptidase (prepilin peptidase) / N-methyltransferase
VPGPLLAAAAVLGLVTGSFLNVVIHRVPRGESLLRPGSHCPACGAAVRRRHNVPVAGWLLLRGRCADCGARVSARYPLVEAGTAALFVAVAARFGLSWQLPAYLYLAAAAVALAAIDLGVRRLPDRIVLPSYPVALLLLLAPAVARHDWAATGRALLAAAALYVLYYVLWFFRAMGGGDLALAPLLGLYLGWLGWAPVLVGVFAGFALGGAAGLVLLAAGVARRRSTVPFGPAMLAGAFLAVLAAAPIAHWYTSLLVPTA